MLSDLESIVKDVETQKKRKDFDPFQKKFVDYTLQKFDSIVEADGKDVNENNMSNVARNLSTRSVLIKAQMDALIKSTSDIESLLRTSTNSNGEFDNTTLHKHHNHFIFLNGYTFFLLSQQK